MRRILQVIAIACLLMSVSAFAQDSHGYFAQSPTWLTINGGPTTNAGAAVNLVSISVPAGAYLITARVDGASYGPNSGASCFFSRQPGEPTQPNSWGYQTVDTSSDYTRLKTTTAIMLGQFQTKGTTISLTCQKGYAFTNSSQFTGTLMLIKPVNLN